MGIFAAIVGYQIAGPIGCLIGLSMNNEDDDDPNTDGTHSVRNQKTRTERIQAYRKSKKYPGYQRQSGPDRYARK